MRTTYFVLLALVVAVFAGTISDTATKMLAYLDTKTAELYLDAGQIFLTENGTDVPEIMNAGSNTFYWARDKPNAAVHSKSKAGNTTDGWQWTDSTYIPLSDTSRVAVFIVIAELLKQGSLTLDDKVSSHISFSPKALDSTHNYDITIRHLLAETSGLETIYRKHPISRISGAPSSMSGLLSEIKDMKFMVPPGYTYTKSPVHWILLGAIIEKLTDKSFTDATDEIFTTLGLDCLFVAKGHVGADAIWATDGMLQAGWTVQNKKNASDVESDFVELAHENADDLVSRDIMTRYTPMSNAMCTAAAVHRISKLFAGQDAGTPHFDDATRADLLDYLKYSIVPDDQATSWVHTIGGLTQLAYYEPTIDSVSGFRFPNWVIKATYEGVQVFSAFTIDEVNLCDLKPAAGTEIDFATTCVEHYGAHPILTVALNTDDFNVESLIHRNFWIRDIGGVSSLTPTSTIINIGSTTVYDARYSYRDSMLLHADDAASKKITFLAGEIKTYVEKLDISRYGERNVKEPIATSDDPFVLVSLPSQGSNDTHKAFVLMTEKGTAQVGERTSLLVPRSEGDVVSPINGCYVSSLGYTYYSDSIVNVPDSMTVFLGIATVSVVVILLLVGLTIMFVLRKDVKKNAQKPSRFHKAEAGLARRFPTLSDNISLHGVSTVEIIIVWIAVICGLGGFFMAYNATGDLGNTDPSGFGALLALIGLVLIVVEFLLTLFKFSFYPRQSSWWWHIVVFVLLVLFVFSGYELSKYGMLMSVDV